MKTGAAKELSYQDIKIGDEASFDAVLTEDDVKTFMRLCGDINPLHSDDTYAARTKFGGTIMHGMLVSSLFSTLVGVYLPGKYGLYVSQELQFKNAVRPNAGLRVRGQVIRTMDALKLITIDTTITDRNSGVVYVAGKAQVQLLQ